MQGIYKLINSGRGTKINNPDAKGKAACQEQGCAFEID